MDKTKEKVERLYKIYGFEKTEETNSYIVFTYSNGYFHNVEIVRFDEKLEENIKQEYENLGFSVRIIDYVSCEETQRLLFNGFFAVDSIHKRLLNEYNNFCELQSKKLFNEKYEYIQPTYTWNNTTGEGKLSNDILSQVRQDGPQLIILEAAAGYGKTCTSYEIVKEIAQQDTEYAPIFIELSKNRKAALFRYVLLDEIDRKFTTLSSDLVISEIRNGNVPLIIDGFDELISRSNKDMGYDDNIADDDSKTMLDTIAELYLKGCSTKIVLTSRKSAIFTGDIFEEWAQNHLPFCNITRISIEEPTIKDWIGYEKANYLEKQRIPFSNIVNPILLAFMRGMDRDRFVSTCSNVEKVISYYFDSLLERERERQALQLSVREQYEIMQKLANNFVEFDIASEELSFIRDMFLEIIHENFKMYRERYISIEERPTEEEFATKLAGHALLNRVSPRKNEIGFINDFIFGIFIGDNILADQSILENMDGKYLEIACTAYASRSEDRRDKLFTLVTPYITRLNYEQQLEIELKLANTIKRDYYEHYFSNRIFNPDIFFDGVNRFNNCTFRNCTFKECIIMTSAFYNCQFYDCKFYDVMVERDTTENCRLLFANCIGFDELTKLASYEDEIDYGNNYEKKVLSRYWGNGERYSKGKLPEMLLLRTHSVDERTGVEKALESLKRKDLIFKEGHYWYLNKDKIKDIKGILEI